MMFQKMALLSRWLFNGLVVLLALVGNIFAPLLLNQEALAAGSLPCDIYAAAGTPCVAAHSTVRALLSAYNGRLYQVRRASDSATTDIGTLTMGGFEMVMVSPLVSERETSPPGIQTQLISYLNLVQSNGYVLGKEQVPQ